MFGSFDPMDVDISVMPLAAYLAGDKGEPVPVQEYAIRKWGNAGLAGGHRDTQLVQFAVMIDLKKGDYVVVLDLPSSARLAGSRSVVGPVAYYERPGVVQRSVLSAGAARWAANVLVAPADGDFNEDGYVDTLDYIICQEGFGSTYDGKHLLQWQRDGGAAAAVSVPESHGAVALYMAYLHPDVLDSGLFVVEPATWMPLVIACCWAGVSRRGRRRCRLS